MSETRRVIFEIKFQNLGTLLERKSLHDEMVMFTWHKNEKWRFIFLLENLMCKNILLISSWEMFCQASSSSFDCRIGGNIHKLCDLKFTKHFQYCLYLVILRSNFQSNRFRLFGHVNWSIIMLQLSIRTCTFVK